MTMVPAGPDPASQDAIRRGSGSGYSISISQDAISTVDKALHLPTGRMRRLRVELQLMGMVTMLWLVGLVHALAWANLGTPSLGPVSTWPWGTLMVPPGLALAWTLGLLIRDLPRTRWPRPAFRGDGAWGFVWLALGWPGLVWAPVLWLRDRWARRDALDLAEVGRAFEQLLDVPRALVLRMFGAGSIALAVDVVVLGDRANWTRDVMVAMAVLWLSQWGLLAALVHGGARMMLRPALLAVPRGGAPTFRQRANLRLRVVVETSLAVLCAIAAPLAAGFLWGITDTAGPSLLPLLATAAAAAAGCSIVAAVFMATDLHRDVTRASIQVAAVADDQAPPPLTQGTFSTREIRQLVKAVDRLVTHINETNIATYVAIERAKEADRLKSQFLANMSHDLRSPLNSILGFSDLLTSGIEGSLTDEQLQMVQLIHHSGRHLLQQIDDILDTAKIEAARLDLHPEPTPPATLLARAVEQAKKQRATPVTYAMDIGAGLPLAMVDPTRAVQALSNVLVFASERMDQGELEIKLRPGRTMRGRRIFITVHTPVAPATAEQLAQARQGFYRIPGHRGLGLGLPIAGSILELSSGSLSIEDHGNGMTFTLELPAPESGRTMQTLRALTEVQRS